MDETYKIAITRLGDRIRLAERLRLPVITSICAKSDANAGVLGQRFIPWRRCQSGRILDRFAPMTPDGTPYRWPYTLP
jgi:hypothetical protein